MVFGLASCGKDDNNTSGGNGSGGNTQNSLVGTQWVASDGDAQITLAFTSATDAEVSVVPPSGIRESYRGTYTYSNGNGTLIMTADSTTYNITFTVSGNTLTAHNTPAGDVVFTRVNGNPQPGPNPGGDLRNSLEGTGWMYMNDEVIVAVEFGPNAMVGVVVSPKNGGSDMEYYGTYTYNNFNGTISINVEGQDYTIHFVVNGETMVASDTPVGNITLTLVGSNPQPGPQPGGNYPLNGTTWQSSFQEDSVYITASISFGTTNCLCVYADSEGHSEQETGTYTYTGTLTSGQGTIVIDGEPGTFVVNGNQATVTADGDSRVFTRVDNGR